MINSSRCNVKLFTCPKSSHTVYGCFLLSTLDSFRKEKAAGIKIQCRLSKYTSFTYDIPTYAFSVTGETRQHLLVFLSCCNSGGIIQLLYSCRFSATTALCDFGYNNTVSVIVFLISNYKLVRLYCVGNVLSR